MQKGKLIELFMASGRDRAFSVMMICAAAALTGTFYYYDRQYSFSTDICVSITFVIFFVWLLFALLSGKDRRIGFIVFSYAYWLIPYLYVLFYNSRDNVRNYDKWLSMINRIASAILKNPFYVAANRLRTDPTVLAAVLLMSVMIFYVLGNFIAYFYDKNFVKVHEMINGSGSELEDDAEDRSEKVNKHKNISTSGSLNDMLFGPSDTRQNADPEIDDDQT